LPKFYQRGNYSATLSIKLIETIYANLPLNLSLTAQAVIALKMNRDINGLIKEDIADAIDRGRIWLENHFRVC